MERLADRYQLRWADKGKCFLGIHEGILVNVSEWDGVVTLKFGSPVADFGSQILEHFAGFTHCAEGGLPTTWIDAMLEQDERGGERASHHFCSVSIDAQAGAARQ